MIARFTEVSYSYPGRNPRAALQHATFIGPRKDDQHSEVPQRQWEVDTACASRGLIDPPAGTVDHPARRGERVPIVFSVPR